MALFNFRKETSERSDESNWTKALLVEKSGFFLESIEGCSQNANNIVTHLIERARVDHDPSKQAVKAEIINEIKKLEGEDSLARKIRFAQCYSLPLSYALYCNENEHVYLFSFSALDDARFDRQFISYQEFSGWIAEIKGWKSNKTFRELQDLPQFDQELRKSGTPWPTNIDCFICDQSNKPIAILEFQNAKSTKVAQHCNNDFFLCKMTGVNEHGHVVYHDDIRRWTSQEIMRVQSNLRYLVITWAQDENDFILKEVDRITIPYFPSKNDKPDWDYNNTYKMNMNKYVMSGKAMKEEKVISDQFKTYNLSFVDGQMKTSVNNPPLSKESKTFPSIYYHSKELVQKKREILVDKFVALIKS